MIQLVPIVVVAWIVTAMLLVIEHIYCADQGRLVRYILGGCALCLGTTLAGVLADDPLLAIVPWVVLSAGSVIIAMTFFERQAAAAKKSAQRSGEVVGAARGLR